MKKKNISTGKIRKRNREMLLQDWLAAGSFAFALSPEK